MGCWNNVTFLSMSYGDRTASTYIFAYIHTCTHTHTHMTQIQKHNKSYTVYYTEM